MLADRSAWLPDPNSTKSIVSSECPNVAKRSGSSGRLILGQDLVRYVSGSRLRGAGADYIHITRIIFMNFTELFNEVVTITKRPDLVDRTNQAIRAATLKIHHSDFYYKDLVEVPVQFTHVFILQSFMPTEVVPNFRKAKYVRLWNGDLFGDVGKFLTPIQIENSLNAYKQIKTDVFYMAGQNLQIRGCAPLDKVLFGCYVHPIISPAGSYKSWIADEKPYAIIYEAARSIFKSISFDTQAQEFSQLVAEEIAEIKLSYIDDVPVT